MERWDNAWHHTRKHNRLNSFSIFITYMAGVTGWMGGGCACPSRLLDSPSLVGVWLFNLIWKFCFASGLRFGHGLVCVTRYRTYIQLNTLILPVIGLRVFVLLWDCGLIRCKYVCLFFIYVARYETYIQLKTLSFQVDKPLYWPQTKSIIRHRIVFGKHLYTFLY